MDTSSHPSIGPDAVEQLRAFALPKLEAYLSHTNQIVGVTGFGIALGCVGLNLPNYFAWLGSLFVLLVWADGIASYKGSLDALRIVNDPSMRPLNILWRARVALVGWLFLGSVALGWVSA